MGDFLAGAALAGVLLTRVTFWLELYERAAVRWYWWRGDTGHDLTAEDIEASWAV